MLSKNVGLNTVVNDLATFEFFEMKISKSLMLDLLIFKFCFDSVLTTEKLAFSEIKSNQLVLNYFNVTNKQITAAKRATASTNAATINIAPWIFPEASG